MMQMRSAAGETTGCAYGKTSAATATGDYLDSLKTGASVRRVHLAQFNAPA